MARQDKEDADEALSGAQEPADPQARRDVLNLGIAKAKADGKYEGRVPTSRRQGTRGGPFGSDERLRSSKLFNEPLSNGAVNLGELGAPFSSDRGV
jgi:hypothetical protein